MLYKKCLRSTFAGLFRKERKADFILSKRMKTAPLAILAVAISTACFAQQKDERKYLYDSTVSTDFDLIQEKDTSSFQCLAYTGRSVHQVWDKRVDGEPLINAFTFRAHFDDGSLIEIVANPEFGSESRAQEEAMRYTRALGQLPPTLRRGINRLSIHLGNEGFHAGTGQIVVYSGTATKRIVALHLEESLFHESVHASWDDKYRKSPLWTAAQKQDGRYLTKYALDFPNREDLAETALFAYALVRNPERIPPVDAAGIKELLPNRLKFLNNLFLSDVGISSPPLQRNDTFSP